MTLKKGALYVPTWRDEQEASVKLNLVPKIKPVTKNHEKFLHNIETHTLNFCFGPSGSGKTFYSIAKAWEMLVNERVECIYLTRPIQACGKELGHLPGSLDEKFFNYCLPMIDNLKEFVGREKGRLVDDAINNGSIKLMPLTYMRGMNLRRSIVIADECQNGQYVELKMLMTRITGSRMVLCGDIRQSDISLYPPIVKIVKALFQRPNRNPDMSSITFTAKDIIRSGLVKDIVEALEEMEIEEYEKRKKKEAERETENIDLSNPRTISK